MPTKLPSLDFHSIQHLPSGETTSAGLHAEALADVAAYNQLPLTPREEYLLACIAYRQMRRDFYLRTETCNWQVVAFIFALTIVVLMAQYFKLAGVI